MVPERWRPPDRPLQDCPGARELYPSGTLARALWEETWPSLTPPRPPLGARGLAQALRLLIYDDTSARPLAPAPPTMPAKAQAQEDIPRAAEARGLPGALLLGTTLPTTFPTRSRTRHDTRRQSFPAAFRGLEAPGPARQPLELTSFTAKKTLEGPPGALGKVGLSRHSMTRRVSE
jgi:hypothetical protein